MNHFSNIVLSLSLCAVSSLFLTARADGMLPETTVVLLHEEDGETSFNVKNTDAAPALLHWVIENIPEDPETLVVVTPPITRVDGGETQRVRFLLATDKPLKTQRLKRVSFEGIPQKKTATDPTVSVTVRQNLPLIVHPRGLAKHRAPWELLKWVRQGNQLVVRNDSAYVVRLGMNLVLNPNNVKAVLERPYVLPGETLKIAVDGEVRGVASVTVQPATVYGFTVADFVASVVDDNS